MSTTDLPIDPKRLATDLAGAGEDELLRAIEENMTELWASVYGLVTDATVDEALRMRLLRKLMPGALWHWLVSNFPDVELDELCERYCELRRKHGEGAAVILGLAVVFAAVDAGAITASAAAIFYLLSKICGCGKSNE